MLIKIKNLELYKRWLTYYERQDMIPAAQRTYAFFKSEVGETPPFCYQHKLQISGREVGEW